MSQDSNPFSYQGKAVVAIADIGDYLKLVPAVTGSPARYLWSSYDAEADVLYVNFKKPSRATDSEITDDDIIIRYEGDEVIGLTILHAGSR
jgi:uncharacterized protein YuzE